jgi:hypothetical protein
MFVLGDSVSIIAWNNHSQRGIKKMEVINLTVVITGASSAVFGRELLRAGGG